MLKIMRLPSFSSVRSQTADQRTALVENRLFKQVAGLGSVQKLPVKIESTLFFFTLAF